MLMLLEGSLCAGAWLLRGSNPVVGKAFGCGKVCTGALYFQHPRPIAIKDVHSLAQARQARQARQAAQAKGPAAPAVTPLITQKRTHSKRTPISTIGRQNGYKGRKLIPELCAKDSYLVGGKPSLCEGGNRQNSNLGDSCLSVLP